ncbi:MAG: hypothetical protein ACRER0_06485 [Gammaproteobacteria bacterium]
MSLRTAAVELPGIVVALPQEMRSFGVQHMRTGEVLRFYSGWLALSGVGPDNARAAANRLIAQDVHCLISWGVAGSLVPALRPGALLLAERVVRSTDGETFLSDETLCERVSAALALHMRVQRGNLWSASDAVLSSAAKRDVVAHAAVVAVDMESAAVAAAATRANLPFIAIKAICDPVERSLPSVALRLISRDGRVNTPALFSAILSGPLTWRALAALRHDFNTAQRTLAAAAPLVLPAMLPA